MEFLWAPLLVESNSDDPVNHRLDERIIRPDTVLRHASLWENADILVFNTYLWWRQGPVKLLFVSVHQCSRGFFRKIVFSIVMDLVFCNFADGLMKKMELVKNWMGMEPWS